MIVDIINLLNWIIKERQLLPHGSLIEDGYFLTYFSWRTHVL